MFRFSYTERWLYVIEYADGCVKVGQTGGPNFRMPCLGYAPTSGRPKKVREFILPDSMPERLALWAEFSLIAQMAELASSRVRREWFYGVPYEIACKIAQDHASYAMSKGLSWVA